MTRNASVHLTWVIHRADGDHIDPDTGLTWLTGGSGPEPDWSLADEVYRNPLQDPIELVAERVRIIESRRRIYGFQILDQ